MALPAPDPRSEADRDAVPVASTTSEGFPLRLTDESLPPPSGPPSDISGGNGPSDPPSGEVALSPDPDDGWYTIEVEVGEHTKVPISIRTDPFVMVVGETSVRKLVQVSYQGQCIKRYFESAILEKLLDGDRDQVITNSEQLIIHRAFYPENDASPDVSKYILLIDNSAERYDFVDNLDRKLRRLSAEYTAKQLKPAQQPERIPRPLLLRDPESLAGNFIREVIVPLSNETPTLILESEVEYRVCVDKIEEGLEGYFEEFRFPTARALRELEKKNMEELVWGTHVRNIGTLVDGIFAEMNFSLWSDRRRLQHFQQMTANFIEKVVDKIRDQEG